MPNVIKPHTRTEIITKDGEVKILLEITLNINTTGTTATQPVISSQNEADETRWEIPSFKTDNKIKFGKKVE